MHAPQIIYIVLMAVSLALNMADHGKPKKGEENFWTSALAAVITTAILWWGGFFK